MRMNVSFEHKDRLTLPLLCLLAVVTLVLDYGFIFPLFLESMLQILEILVALIFIFLLGWDSIRRKGKLRVFRAHCVEFFFLGILVLEFVLFLFKISFLFDDSVHSLRVALHLYIVSAVGSYAVKAGQKLFFLSLSPAASVLSTFFLLIFLGAIALLLPCATHGTLTPNISIIDALFTATSAVCVTGLIVVDTATAFSRTGQTIILVLIQLGALGIMTYAGIFALAFGQKMSMRGRYVLQDILKTNGAGRVSSILPAIVATTFLCELLGAIPLYLGFRSTLSVQDSIFTALFHSISAFCNAGFSTFSNSLENFTGSIWINLPIILLIILGGLGFSVINESYRLILSKTNRKSKKYRLSLHTQLVWRMSLILIGGGFLLILLGGDWSESSWTEIIWAGLFQSVTTRTAGFNSISLHMLAPWLLVLFMMFMFIGGAPGGTAGGIKVSTFGVLFHACKSMMRGRNHVEILRRTLSDKIVRSAFVISGLAANYVAFTIVLLTWTEPDLPFFDLVFEAFSAFGTVGLSLGVTPQLSTLGKVIIIVTMFVGRVGPLTLFLALARKRDEALYSYPAESVIVG